MCDLKNHYYRFPVTVRHRAWQEAEDGTTGSGGDFWVSHFKTSLDWSVDTGWVQTQCRGARVKEQSLTVGLSGAGRNPQL